MFKTLFAFAIPAALLGVVNASPATADPTFFDTGTPDGRIATASRLSGNGNIEIESADDFVLTQSMAIEDATFTGLLTGVSPDIQRVVVEIYRVFPNDSNAARTPNVPTRTNSPSDDALASRDSQAAGELSFTTSVLQTPFTAANSVLNGINPKPNQTTLGEGAVTGEEVRFSVDFTMPFDLPAGHYFFVPQVLLAEDDQFYWLSAAGPTVAGDLQSWIRNENLAPDWLRVGTDIVGGVPAPKFNASFSLSGSVIPEPTTWTMMMFGFAGLGFVGYRSMRRNPLVA